MKNYFIKSRVTGKVRKTKHINFYYSGTGCFRFGFKIRRTKSGDLNIVSYWGEGICPPINVNAFKRKIMEEKKYCDRKFGLVRK